jgi:ATP-dependent exoDNAse (exonuclease V) alpha subunit
MALYFLNMQTFGRSHGSSAPSLAAYRSGERIHDDRTGRTYDHTDRQGVMHKEIVLPARFAGADMSWAADRSALWNAAEAAEKPKNARVAREYLVAVPIELTHPQRVDMVRAFARELAERYGFAVDAVLHAPRDFPGSDPRNFHAHLLATTREVSREGLGKKTTLDLNDDNRRKLGLGPAVRELLYVRQRWAEVANLALEAAHVDARIDHRSLAAQGITRAPKLWIPRIPYEIERRGGHSFIAERIREDHRARLEAQHAATEFHRPDLRPERGAEREHSMARTHDLARQSAEKWAQHRREDLTSGGPRELARAAAERWLQHRRERQMSGEPEPSAGDSARKWAEYRRHVLEEGSDRAAERPRDRTRSAGHEFGHDRDPERGPERGHERDHHDRDYDFSL